MFYNLIEVLNPLNPKNQMLEVMTIRIHPKWKAFFIVALGIFMSTLDGSILSIANPIIAENFNVSINSVQWVVTAYMLVITSTLITFGRLGDKIGVQLIFTWGFLLFALGSLFCSLADALLALIAARIFQGLGASMMMATGMGIISNTFPPEEKGKALGLTGTIVGLGNMSGPAIGGIILSHFSWPAIFLINVPIGIIAFLYGLKVLPTQPQDKTVNRFDLPGIFLFGLFTVTLLLSLSGSAPQSYIWVICLISFIIFIYWENKAPQSLLDFELFRIMEFTCGNIMALAAYSAQMTVLFLLPFYLNNILLLSSSVAGILMTIMPISVAVTAPFAGSLSDRIGSHKILVGAFSLMVIAYLTLSSLTVDSSIFQLCAGLFLLGVGMGSFASPNNSNILGSIPRGKVGYGGGFGATVRNFAFATGTALSSSILTLFLNINQTQLPYKIAYIHANNMVYRISAFITLFGLFMVFYTKRQRTKLKNSTF